MLDIMKIPQQVVVLSEDSFKLMIDKMPTVCIFGALWCGDTEKLMLEALPQIIEKYDWILRFCFVAIESRRYDPILCPLLRREFGIFRYPSIAGFVQGKMLDSGIIISEGSIDEQTSDLEAVAKLVSIS